MNYCSRGSFGLLSVERTVSVAAQMHFFVIVNRQRFLLFILWFYFATLYCFQLLPRCFVCCLNHLFHSTEKLNVSMVKSVSRITYVRMQAKSLATTAGLDQTNFCGDVMYLKESPLCLEIKIIYLLKG